MSDFERIAQVIRYLDERHREQPSLAQISAQVGLSPFHFHRLFSRWAGITPKEFLTCLTLTHAKQSLRAGRSVLDAALDAGLSGPGRLHDLCVNLEAASPGELKSGGDGWTIRAGLADSPFGSCLVGQSPRGICYLAFVPSKSRRVAAARIEAQWPRATIRWDESAQQLVTAIFDNDVHNVRKPLKLFVSGTRFQLRVWRALLQIPPGTLTSYGRIAESLGDPAAARAVGAAIGQNRIAYLIPCHRVIRQTGAIGDYRWGNARKKAMIAWETACRTREKPLGGPQEFGPEPIQERR